MLMVPLPQLMTITKGKNIKRKQQNFCLLSVDNSTRYINSRRRRWIPKLAMLRKENKK